MVGLEAEALKEGPQLGSTTRCDTYGIELVDDENRLRTGDNTREGQNRGFREKKLSPKLRRSENSLR